MRGGCPRDARGDIRLAWRVMARASREITRSPLASGCGWPTCWEKRGVPSWVTSVSSRRLSVMPSADCGLRLLASAAIRSCHRLLSAYRDSYHGARDSATQLSTERFLSAFAAYYTVQKRSGDSFSSRLRVLGYSGTVYLRSYRYRMWPVRGVRY